MDWAGAIERNSEALKAIVATLFVMLGGAAVARIPRPLHSAVLSVLRPAEAAARRLIVIAARGLEVKPAPSRAMPLAPIGRGGRRRFSFRLFDPRKRLAHDRRAVSPRVAPRIRIVDFDPRVLILWPPPPAPAAPPDDSHVDASRLSSRLQALKLALDDLPRQARRLVRLKAKRDKAPSLAFRSPLRPGRPPGHRRIPLHEIDHVLAECHGLARDAIAPNTS